MKTCFAWIIAFSALISMPLSANEMSENVPQEFAAVKDANIEASLFSYTVGSQVYFDRMIDIKLVGTTPTVIDKIKPVYNFNYTYENNLQIANYYVGALVSLTDLTAEDDFKVDLTIQNQATDEIRIYLFSPSEEAGGLIPEVKLIHTIKPMASEEE